MAAATLLTCKHGKSYNPAKESCADCDAEPPTPEAPRPGEGELACAEAERLGLPNIYECEARAWESWSFARDRKFKLTELADRLFESMDPDDLDRALKAEAIAAKWGDTEIKAEKLGGAPVIVRERIAAADRADREHARQERSN